MKTYIGNSTYKFEAYTIYSTADHLSAYREEYPTRRRQLNAANKDIENMREAIEGIQARLNDGRTYTHYMGDQYNAGDLADMRQDLANLEAARDFIDAAPCPAKIAKELDAQIEAAKQRQEAEAEAAANEPQKVTIELPEGVTPFDISNIFQAAQMYAHAERMKTIGDGTNKTDIWSHIYKAAAKIDADQLHDIAWATDTAVDEYRAKNCIIHL